MDGILSEETFKRLQEQAQADRQVSDLSSLRKETIPGLERDAKLLSKYVELAKTGVRNRYRGDTSTVPAAERLWYAEQAAMLQPSIEKRVQAAGLIPSVQEQPVAQQVQASSQQPQPTAQPEAPAQPSSNAPAPTPEKPQYDPFEQFSELMRQRDDFRARAFQYAKQTLPREDWLDAMSIADKYVSERFKAPQNIAQPIIDQFTGKPLEGFALIGGKVEKIEKPKVEDDGRSVIGYEGKAPTQGEAVKFREQVSDINSGVSALDELIQLGRKGSSLSPTDRARAQNLARMIQGKFRVEIVGPGAVTENDRKVLEDVVASPLDIFRLSDVPTLLMDMKSRILSAKNEKAFQLGLTPTGQKQQQQSAPGGVVKAVRMPGGSLTRQ